MTDIEMLPLPEPLPRVLVHVLHEGDMELEAVGNYYAAEQVRACVAHATAAKDAEIERLAEALRLIASPKRPDGTWNRDREACRQIAEEALRNHGQEGKDG